MKHATRKMKHGIIQHIARSRLHIAKPRWPLLAGVCFLIVLLPVAALTLRSARPAAAGWWDGNWLYRKAIDITNNTSAENNVYTSHTIDTSDTSRFQTDCGDLRFTHQTGKVLKYYIVSGCGTGTTVIHVFHDTLAAGRQTIYMYYGNANATNGFESAGFSTVASNYTISATGSEQTTPGPIAYWKFDEGQGQSINDQTKKNNGTLGANSSSASDDPTWVEEGRCVTGKCLQFDGSNDFVDLGNPATLNIPGAISISAWIKTNSLSVAYKHIVSNYNSAGTYAQYDVTQYGQQIRFAIANAGGYEIYNTGNVITATNTWYHIEVTNDGSDNVFIYVNGIRYTPTKTGAVATPTASYGETAIGRAGDYTSDLWNGFIDEVKIYPYVRSASEVRSDYNQFATRAGSGNVLGDQGSLSNGLIGYWPMDESAANSCTGGSNDTCDKSGNGVDGAWTGNVAASTGKFGNGTTYDGTGDYVTTTDYSWGPTQPFTVSVWVNTNSAASKQGIVGKSDNYEWMMYLESNGTPGFHYYDSGAGDSILMNSSTVLATNTWYHLLATSDGKTAKLYINGQLSVTDTTIATTHMNDSNPVKIGYTYTYGAWSSFNGEIDEVRLYSRSFSPEEVRQLYNWAPGPVGYWNFDEKTGQSANDISGNGYTGTFAGNAKWGSGKYGGAVDLDGTTDYVTVGSASDFKWMHGAVDSTNFQLTVGAWYKRRAAPSDWDMIVATNNFNGATVGMWLDVSAAGAIEAYITDGAPANDPLGGHSTGASTFPNDGNWHYIAWTFDHGLTSANSKIYLDGKLISTANKSGTSSPSSADSFGALRFGAQPNSGASADGYLDDIKIYKYARTPQQIIEDMNGGHPAGGSPVGSQIARYNLDEQQGTTAKNSVSANSFFSGTISGATWKTKVDCKINGCLDFDGSDDVTTITNTSAIDLNENLASGFTWSGWIYPDTAGEGTNGQIFFKGTNTWLRVDTLSGGKLDIEASLDLATTDATVNVTGVITQSAWNHIALSYSDDGDDEITIWVNGNPVGVSTNGVGSPAADMGNFLIGGTTTANFDGKIDEVEIYNSELNKEGIGIIMNANAAVNFGADTNEAANLSDGAGNPPVGYWNFDEKTGQNTYDTSGNNYTGTLGANSSVGSDDPIWAPAGKCQSGPCLKFDGTDDFVDLGDPSGLDVGTSDFTISSWIYPETGNTTRVFFSKETSSSSNYQFRFQLKSDDKLAFIICNSNASDCLFTSDYTLLSPNAIPENSWSYVAVTRTGTSYSMYINGQLVDTASSSTIIDHSSTTSYRISSRNGNDLPFKGYIDQVKLYKSLLTPAQIAYDYNRGGPVAHYKFDECQGSTVNDASGNGNNGTINIGASGTQTSIGTCSTSSSAWGNGSGGKYNSSLNFDGADDYVTITNPTSLVLTQHTISAWVKPSSTGSWRGIAGKMSGVITGSGSNRSYSLWLDSDNDIFYEIVGIAGDCFIWRNGGVGDKANIPANSGWHLITGTYDGTAAKIYLDGKEVHSTACSQTPKSGNGDFTIGAYDSYKVGSTIDDIRVYNYALGTNQVQQLYNNGAAVFYGPDSGNP